MFRRAVGGTLWFKVLAALLVFAGLSHKASSLLVAALVAVIIVKHLVDGNREQYWEPEAEQYARHWEDLVWGNSRWMNAETPEQGVERLAGPFRPPVPDDKHVAFPDDVPQNAPHFINYQEWGTTRYSMRGGDPMTKTNIWGWGG